MSKPSVHLVSKMVLAPRRVQETARSVAHWRSTATPTEDLDLVFATDRGQPLTAGWVRKAFYRLLDDSGLPHLPLRGLRHTMATLMLAAGEHPKVVSERLGHGNPSFTLAVYGHVVPGMHEAASRRIEETLALPPSVETAGAK